MSIAKDIPSLSGMTGVAVGGVSVDEPRVLPRETNDHISLRVRGDLDFLKEDGLVEACVVTGASISMSSSVKGGGLRCGEAVMLSALRVRAVAGREWMSPGCIVILGGWIQGRGAVVGCSDGVLSVLTVWLNASVNGTDENWLKLKIVSEVT